jgi:transmembrane protein
MPPAILEPLDRVIRLFLQAPATTAAARIVLCLPFWWSGLSKLLDFSGGTAEMAALGLEPAWLLNALTILVQLGGSLLVILNRWTWLGAGALGVFTALATVTAHRFWTLDGIERVRELNIFLEHLAIIAGFVLVAILGVVGVRASPEQQERAPPSGGYVEQRFRRKSNGDGHGQATREALR